MNGLAPNQLNGIRLETNRIVRSYNLGKFDALKALDESEGNCFSKAMIACGLIVLKHSVQPSLVYKKSVHGSPDQSLEKAKDPVTKRNIAHVVIAVPSPNPEVDHRVPSLHFGAEVYGTANSTLNIDRGEVWSTYNNPENYVEVARDGSIVTTPLADEKGMFAGNWQDVSPDYLAALDREPLDIDILLNRLATKDYNHGEAA